MPFRNFLLAVWTAFDKNESGNEISKGFEMPTKVALVLVWLSENISGFIGKKPALTTKDLGDSLAERWFNNERAREVLGYVPTVKIADALREAAAEKKRVEGMTGERSTE